MSKKKRNRKSDPFDHRSHFKSFVNDLEGLLDLENFREKYLHQVLTSKLLDPDFSDPPEVRRQRAIDKWLAVEGLNRETNERLRSDEYDQHVLWYTCKVESEEGQESTVDPSVTIVNQGPTVERFERFARRLIVDVLGTSVPYGRIRELAQFSNGASTSTRRGPGTVPRKFLSGCDSTASNLEVFRDLNNSVHWNPLANLVEGNVLFTVPKTTDIDRVACKEPDLNMYVQKGIGNYFRERLRKHGVDLNDQSHNQDLARIGSITGELATVDLSSASDTVTQGVVERLLPCAWVSFLKRVRSPFTFIEGHGWHHNEMMSSMGNAFTFELESLIFWALTRSVCYFTQSKGRVSVYGDDIICPASAVTKLAVVFEMYGFKLNLDKSHYNGHFRESCGKHYFQGTDVSPFFIKKVPEDISDWIHLLNSLRAWLERGAIADILDQKFYGIWKDYAEKLIPKPLWGGWDTSRRDILVAYGRRPLARYGNKQYRNGREERSSAYGAYLQWLATADRRAAFIQEEFSEPLVTSEYVTDGSRTFSRIKTPIYGRPTKVFIQELG